MGGNPGGGLVQAGRRLREARDDRAHGGIGEFGRRTLVDLRPQLHLDDRGPCGQSRLSSMVHTVMAYNYKANGAEA